MIKMDIIAYLSEPQNLIFYSLILPLIAVMWIFVYAYFNFAIFLLVLITTIILFIEQFYPKKPKNPIKPMMFINGQ